MKKTLDTPFAFLSLEDEILFVKMKPNVDVSEVELKELFELSNDFTNFQKRFVIVDTRENFTSSSEIRSLYANENYTKFRYADAFIVNSLPMRLLVNFYISVNKPEIPTKMFNNSENAYDWISNLKKETLKKS